MHWLRRLLNVFRPDRLSRDLDAEITTHLAERIDDLMASGMSEAAAATEAHRRFGNRGRQKEAAHDIDGVVWLESLVTDIRYAVRGLRASPGFTLVAVLSLGLGIGANTAIFSLTDAVALKSLPVRHPEQLINITMGKGGEYFTNPLWEQLRDRPELFSAAMAYSSETFNLADGGEVQPAPANIVSGSFFGGLGVRAIAGRLILPTDDVRSCPGVLAVSAGFAERTFGSPGAAVGKIVSVEGHPFPIIGVIDPAFVGIQVGRPVDLYAPLCSQVITTGRTDILEARSRWYITILARPRAGIALEAVRNRLALLAPQVFQATVPADWGADNRRDYLKGTLDSRPAANGLSELRDTYQGALLVLMGVVAAVLLIACANIANLLLARAARRQREIAIRLAIGAGRGRLIRQLLTESLLLSLAGALLGVLFARWASQFLVGFLATDGAPIWLDLSLDTRVLAFTILAATLTGIVFGVAPAWRAARVDPQSAMKSGGRGIAPGDSRHRLGRALVAGQVALSLALVATAGLLLGSFHNLATLDPGFRRDGTLLVEMDLARAGFKERQLVTVQQDVLRRIRELPGATASASMITPVGNFGWNDIVLAPGFVPASRRDSLAYFNQVSDGYFAAMGTRLLAGRDISADDIAQARSVAVISETMARRVFGAVDPIGRTFRTPIGDSASPPRQVIGVVQDARYQRLDEPPQAIAYFPLGVGDDPRPQVNFEIRSNRPLAEAVAAVRRLAQGVNPATTLRIRTLSSQLSASLTRPRLLAVLSGFFGLLALLLATIGLYGTISYNVAQRRNELGIRMALGAERLRILRMVIGDAGRLLAAGTIAGLGLTFAGTRLIGSFLYGMTPTDPVTLLVAAAVLGLAGFIAACVPAWRAARTDPMGSLRED